MNRVFILGAGGHARVCAEVAEAAGWIVLAFVEEPRSADERINGKPVKRASLSELRATESGLISVFIAYSDNAERLRLIGEAAALGLSVASLIHPFSAISPSCMIGVGTVVMPGAIVNANARIGRGCILNTACSIDHDSDLGDGVQIAPGVHGASTVSYGTEAFVGIGTSIRQGLRIGARSVIGAGTVVIRDVPDQVTVVGNPGRILKDRPKPRSR